MAQHHNGAIRIDSQLQPGPRTWRLFDVKSTYDIRKNYCQSISAEIMLFDIEFYASGKRSMCRMHG